MKMPDIVGMNLERAEEILGNKGIMISNIRLTVSPLCRDSCRDSSCKNYLRVLRVECTGENKVEILACNPFCNLNT